MRTGLSFYPEGQLKSLELARPTPIQTPIGQIFAYDCQSIGINGDDNSLCFSEKGVLISLVTTTNQIKVQGHSEEYQFAPGFKPNLFNPEALDPIPLKIRFTDNKVMFYQDGVQEFDIQEYSFSIESLKLSANCSSCSSCDGCGNFNYDREVIL
ncbi:hypothetical protein N752_12245 [Desulforamulus aquiferis]|nr:hypothetical protein [Desulforamulus aquiferis]RYD04951.1 hypothetical protein N752_12245 [Desulforamulus aquiferis]